MAPAPASKSKEREALDRLIASGVFAKSPNLEKIVLYLCQRYFEGTAGSVKEYSIATEALGRAETFDPKKDSIVRVEMHRLRRRLREHYESAPPDQVRIHIPEKSYAPLFTTGETAVVLRDEPSAQLVPANLEPVAVAVAAPMPRPSRLRLAEIAVIVGLLTLGFVSLLFWFRSPAPSNSAQQADSPAPPPANPETTPAALAPSADGDVIRIMAGRPAGRYTDRYGAIWDGDHYYTGGNSLPVNATVSPRGFDINAFAQMREGVEFRYDIPLRPGTYELTLLFAETQYGERNPLGGGQSSRIFSITANGKPLLSQFDVLADTAEANVATARRFRDLSPAADGKLHLFFGNGAPGRAFLNAMILQPGVPGRALPFRMVCQTESFRDSRGQVWEPDHFFRGGKQITRPHGAPVEDGDRFIGERYGNFSYAIPVPPGRYTARLHFWEYWWGEGRPGRGGAGSRVFDVFANHQSLLSNFDIIGSGARDQVVIHTVHGLQPNAQGKLVFEFNPKANYGMVNAFEILDEAR